MKSAEFKDWIESIERMSRRQGNKLRARLEGKTSVDEVITLIEQVPNAELVCFYCKGTKLYRWGKAGELQTLSAVTAIAHLMR